MKAKNDLGLERRKNIEMRKTIETEQQEKNEAAFSSLLAHVLQDQARALTLEATVVDKERHLKHREKKIEQLEVYLSEGQKQLKYRLEQEGVRLMSVADREHIKREAYLECKKAFAEKEDQLATQLKGLLLREGTQRLREKQYKVQIRDALEAEVRDASVFQDEANDIATIEYKRGFDAGKEAGRKEALEEAQKNSFLEGYAACHCTQTALHNLHEGRIAHDSPELAFLFDAGHPDNLFNRGQQIGLMKKNRVDVDRVPKDSVQKDLVLTNDNGHIIKQDKGHEVVYEQQPVEPMHKQVSHIPIV